MNNARNDQGLGPSSADDSAYTDSGTPEAEATDTVTSPEQSELESLRQQMSKKDLHADRKITELGQDNSSLRQDNQQLHSQVQSMQAQLNQLQSQTSDNSGYDGYGNADSGGSAPAGVNSQEWDLYKQGVGELVNKVYTLEDQLSTTAQQKTEEVEVANLSQQFGLSAEDAKLALDYQRQGDFVNAHKVIDLASAQSKSRNAARQRRTNYDEPVGSTDFRVDSRSQQSISEMFGESAQPQTVARQLAENPDLLDKLAKQFTNS